MSSIKDGPGAPGVDATLRTAIPPSTCTPCAHLRPAAGFLNWKSDSPAACAALRVVRITDQLETGEPVHRRGGLDVAERVGFEPTTERILKNLGGAGGAVSHCQ